MEVHFSRETEIKLTLAAARSGLAKPQIDRCYRVKGDLVEISRIWHGAQNRRPSHPS